MGLIAGVERNYEFAIKSAQDTNLGLLKTEITSYRRRLLKYKKLMSNNTDIENQLDDEGDDVLTKMKNAIKPLDEQLEQLEEIRNEQLRELRLDDPDYAEK